jgi:hypothetical protein
MEVPEVVGQEVSAKALTICRERFPGLLYRLIHGSIAGLDFNEGYFDLIISTRVLSAVLPDRIRATMDTLCVLGSHVYVNEMTDSDYSGPSSHWFKHDYDALFRMRNFSIARKGTIPVREDGKEYLQTWVLYEKG